MVQSPGPSGPSHADISGERLCEHLRAVEWAGETVYVCEFTHPSARGGAYGYRLTYTT